MSETKKYTAQLIGGRTFQVDATGGIPSLTRRYLIDLGEDPDDWTADEEDILSETSGLPALKSAYSEDNDLLLVSGYQFSQGEGQAKRLVTVDVSYSIFTTSMSESNKPLRGHSIESLGWRSGTVSRDLVRNVANGKMLVNSAGQPFDSVPQVDIPSPVFTKVVKKTDRQAGWLAAYGCINAKALTIGGVAGGAHCWRCVQCDEEKLFNDDFGFQYKYTIGFQLMTNSVVIAGGNTETDIGWDLAIVDTGTCKSEAWGGTTKTVPIRYTSPETGQLVTVTAPVLLDGSGLPQLDPDTAVPYAFRIQAYPETTFNESMYSENDDETKKADTPSAA